MAMKVEERLGYGLLPRWEKVGNTASSLKVGKMGNTASSLTRYFVILTEKNKEIHTYGKYAILEGNLVKLEGNSDLLAGK